jgi:flagellar capping protein FliD
MKIQQRTIHKSIRISSNLYNFVEEFEGTTWNDKINNLLEFYMYQDKKYRDKLQDLEHQIEDKQKLLSDFQNKISKFQDLLK